MVIGIDFNGTIMSYDYPNSIGHDIGAVPVLKRIIEAGHDIVLMTSVSPEDGGPASERFHEMLQWFSDNKIPIIGVNKNPKCPAVTGKARCDLFIDDHNLGCPLIYDEILSPGKPYVNWEIVEKWLEQAGII